MRNSAIVQLLQCQGSRRHSVSLKPILPYSGVLELVAPFRLGRRFLSNVLKRLSVAVTQSRCCEPKRARFGGPYWPGAGATSDFPLPPVPLFWLVSHVAPFRRWSSPIRRRVSAGASLAVLSTSYGQSVANSPRLLLPACSLKSSTLWRPRDLSTV